MNIEKANTEATERMMEARPVLVGLGKARDVIPGMRDNLLLHAGPPITWERASGPMQGAITGALIFEGKATNEAEAQALVESGEIELDAPLRASGRTRPLVRRTVSSGLTPAASTPRLAVRRNRHRHQWEIAPGHEVSCFLYS